jgi:two-component system, LytTR family, sensor kinase
MKRTVLSQTRLFSVLIHILIWSAFIFIPLLFMENIEARMRFMIFGWSMMVLMAGYFYFNYLFLIPRFLLQKKLAHYVVFLFAGLLVISSLNVIYCSVIHGYFIPNIHHRGPMRYAIMTISPAILAFGLSTSIRITDEWFKNERQRKEMENEKLTSELAFLKSQVNPHFLFNILNNICSLARKKSDDTENAIIKLSQLMRYMMFESKDEKVSLEKEVEYLQNYIELQKMRISGKVQIHFTVEGPVEQSMIEPMLLISFVENAFKHGISYIGDSGIDIFMKVSSKELNFSVENNIVSKGAENIPSEPGVGLKNVLRRLELLYPGKHNISINDNNQRYKVLLTIKF